MKSVKLLCVLISLLTLIVGSANADFNFPYATINLNLPLYDEPFNGVGNYYSGLSNSIRTALWNPAGIAKMPTVEASATMPLSLGSNSFVQTVKVEDFDFAAGSTGLSTGVFLDQ